MSNLSGSYYNFLPRLTLIFGLGILVHLAVMLQSALIIEAKLQKMFHNNITLLTFTY